MPDYCRAPGVDEQLLRAPQFDAGVHAGLLFNRAAPFDIGQPATKHDWLTRFCKNVGDRESIEDIANSQFRLVSALKGTSVVIEATSPWLTGAGQPHITETGFTWHPISGAPYFQGASIKGALRAWLEITDNTEMICNWFGESTEADSGSAGDLIFFDAVPFSRISLELDVLTPHNGDWVAKGASNPPNDWTAPIPIKFIAAGTKSKLLLSVASRSNQSLDPVFEQLALALEFMGIGAKTSSGYGRFKFSSDSALEQLSSSLAEEKAAKERESLSPEMLQYQDAIASITDPSHDARNPDAFIAAVGSAYSLLADVGGDQATVLAQAVKKSWFLAISNKKKRRDREQRIRSDFPDIDI